MITLLATNTAAPVEGDRLFVDLLPWLGLILLLVAALAATIFIGRRMTRRDDDASDQPFTLQSLRELHASGQLSDEEFQRAREAMIGRIRASTDESTDDTSDADTPDADAPAKPTDGGEHIGHDPTAEGQARRSDDADNDDPNKPGT